MNQYLPFFKKVFKHRFLVSKYGITLSCTKLESNMGNLVDEFNSYRGKMNEKILGSGNKVMKRIYGLDTLTYKEGALSSKVKEMLGLSTSLVLRCDDCVKYHLEKCYEQGVSTEEIFEVFSVANLVGGTICIPHTRRAVEYWEELNI